MVLKELTKIEGSPMYRAAYQTTYALNWPRLLCLATTLLVDMGEDLESILAGVITDNESMKAIDITESFKKVHNIFKCPELETEHDVIRLIGDAGSANGYPIDVWLYKNSRACVLTFPYLEGKDIIEKWGRDFFTQYLDAIEIETEVLFRKNFEKVKETQTEEGHDTRKDT